MTDFDRKAHWEKIYNTKELTEVSWYQPKPLTSLHFIQSFNLPLDASIIDVGGGDSFLVDELLNLGYLNISVLDISEAAIERAKKRLAEKSNLVQWIVSDITNFQPNEQYDCWHDRAAFHFLTSTAEQEQYVNIVSTVIKPKRFLVVGTFSENGPTKCSGIPIQQYSAEKLVEKFSPEFSKIDSQIINHTTPFDTIQNFVFTSFQKN